MQAVLSPLYPYVFHRDYATRAGARQAAYRIQRVGKYYVMLQGTLLYLAPREEGW